ncbi:qsox2 [Symbiodinium sp. CCMP2592]|nr:qsox2 [Symbiodinium sp. CCMP2592]
MGWLKILSLVLLQNSLACRRWWRRKADGLWLREAGKCPWKGGGSLWGELEVPSEAADNRWLSSDGESGRITITVELERDGVAEYELNAFEEKSPQDVADRFAELGRRCSKAKPRRTIDCGPFREGTPHTLSNKIGEKACQHPEAKDARALFCRYPPRFYGHAGICNQYSQFCPFEELRMETDPYLIDTAVINVDAEMFHSMEECGVFERELWIFKVFVHWCPHCQQLMPLLYRLALVLRQRGIKGLRFGAVNCATEHELCAAQNWPGHPLLIARYLGPDRAVHDAIEHWVDVVKDAQLRQMLPRYALPGEFPVLKILLEQLPSSMLPKSSWSFLFDADAEHAQSSGCANLTALHLDHPEGADDRVGNGWHDAERNFTTRQRWTDAMLMLRHVLQEWIAPLGDDGNADAFSHWQLLIMESWVELLARNLPDAFGLAEPLQELQGALLQRVRASQTPEGSSLCADEWKLLTAPVLTRIAEVGQRDFVVASACASDTCRMWSLLHTLASEGFRREQAELSSKNELILSPSSPDVMMQTVHDFLEQFFKCHYCRRHFLKNFEAGSFGRDLAKTSRQQVVLYFWRFHNAVSVRVTAWHGCNTTDRRWPPSSVCSRCWEQSTDDWPVLSEAKDVVRGGESRALDLKASPNEAEILKFLQSAFAEPDDLS